MPTRTIVLTALSASCVSSLVTLGVALLLLAPALRVGPNLQAVQSVMRAERFDLLDTNGTVRASLHTEAQGAGLILRDATDTSRVVLVTDPGVGHGLFVIGEAARGAVVVGASTSNTLGLQVTSADGSRAYVQTGSAGTGFAVADAMGRSLWRVP
jgi:hypothetical protein